MTTQRDETDKQGIRVSVPSRIMMRELDGEAILLNADTGHYFSLDKVGTRMWRLLVDHGNVDTVCRALLDEYEVREDRLRRDLVELVSQLASHGLLRMDER
jgi:hypothetical protein